MRAPRTIAVVPSPGPPVSAARDALAVTAFETLQPVHALSVTVALATASLKIASAAVVAAPERDNLICKGRLKPHKRAKEKATAWADQQLSPVPGRANAGEASDRGYPYPARAFPPLFMARTTRRTQCGSGDYHRFGCA